MVQALAVPWVIPVIFGCLVAIVAIVANVISSTVTANAETDLKRRLVEQGYSADDIVRIVRATSQDNEEADDEVSTPARPSKPPKQYKSVV